MHLSRMLLSTDRLHNPYEMHRILWQAFPEATEEKRHFLFRVEQRSTQQATVLMQSQTPPQAQGEMIKLLASKEISLALKNNMQLRFLLVANPIKTITDQQGRKNSKGESKKCRVPLINEEQQTDWIKRKFDKAASIIQLEIEKQLPLNFHKKRRYGKIQPYVFKGQLAVHDPGQLNQLIQQGIGPAKSFGCGMLSLAR